MINLYGCCGGLDKLVYGTHPRLHWANFLLDTVPDYYSSCYDPDYHELYENFLTYTRNRVGTGPLSNAITYPEYNGEWATTYDHLTQAISVDGFIPSDLAGSETLDSTTINGDGTERVRVYSLGGETITETDTLSDRYTDAMMRTDVAALFIGFNWDTLDRGSLRLFSYEFGTGIKIHSDFTIDDWVNVEVLNAIDRSFYDARQGAYILQAGKFQVANVYSVRTSTYFGDGVYANGVDDGSATSCSDHATGDCHLRDLIINYPSNVSNVYCVKTILQKNRLC